MNAASLIVVGAFPSVDGEDISQNLTQFNKSLNTGASLGQSITTGTNVGGYELSSFTLRNNSALTGLVGVTFAVRIAELDTVATTGTASYVTILTTQTGFTYTGDLIAGDFLTFNLDPVALGANKIYGIEIDVLSNGTGTGFSGQMSARGSNSYAGGNFYTPQATFSNDPLPSAVTLNSEDLTFHANLSAIPEPTTALLGGLGMLALLRRRR